ncbi:gamma-glutamyltransferase [Cryptococcus neoformans]|nr:gamma-glutamyltransferase [Cryptococcus neoformans var. grubii]
MPSIAASSPDHDENAPLLASPTLEAGTTRPPTPSPPWQFWNRPPFRRVHFAEHDQFVPPESVHSESEISADGNERYGTNPKYPRQRLQQEEKMGRWMMYCLLVLVGMVFGTLISRNWQNKGVTGDMPMVPPVWTLPPPTGLPRNDAYLINATTAAVASEDVTCSNLGLSILQDKNGSAVDAAITTTLCIGLLNAFSSGIGGGGFMVVRVPETHEIKDQVLRDIGYDDELGESRVVALDFRETSPALCEKDTYGTHKAGRMAAQVGGLAIGVPGELRGLEAAHKLYGTLPWKDVVMPVAELAKGWRVSRELARRLRLFGDFMLSSPTWSAVYAPRGPLLVEGDFIQRLNYGKTLEKIAEEGASAFYQGEIAESSVKTIAKAGGVMTLDDLKSFKALSYPAIHSTFMSKEIYTTSAPSSGGVMLGLLNVLEPLNITSNNGLKNPLNLHRFIEALKFAFGARSWVTDPAFAKDKKRFEEVYTKEWADEIREKITDNETHSADYYGLQYDTPIDHGTTHLSAVDKWGGAASVTSTINLIWGSHVMDPKTGIIFNDEQDDFAVPGAPDAFGLWPSPWNYPAPGKKPLSSTSASIILNPTTSSSPSPSLYAVIGGSGGSRIFPSVAQVLLNLFSGLDISESIEAYRVHNQIVPDLTTIEVGPEGVDGEVVEGLKERGHKIGEFDVNIGISEVQAIVVEDGHIFASSDSRKNGIAAGY